MSSTNSASSDSTDSENEDNHPMDQYITERHKRKQSSLGDSPQNKDGAIIPLSQQQLQGPTRDHDVDSDDDDDDDDDDEEEDIDDLISREQESSSSSEDDLDLDDSEDEIEIIGQEEEEGEYTSDSDSEMIIRNNVHAIKQSLPVGVTIVNEGEEPGHSIEMIRLLRTPRYFDDDYEESGMRCFRCGGSGHRAKDCTSTSTGLRPCFICAEYGHDSKECPNSICWRCEQPGHQARDCLGVSRWDADKKESKNRKKMRLRIVCIQCGSATCPCAGLGDYARAEGGCTNTYPAKDIAQVMCYTCGKYGHTGCGRIDEELPRPSCSNCGDGGHTAVDCHREESRLLKAERERDRRKGGYGNTNSYNNNSSNYKTNYNKERSRDRYTGDAYTGGGGGRYARGNTSNNDGTYKNKNTMIIRPGGWKKSISIDNRIEHGSRYNKRERDDDKRSNNTDGRGYSGKHERGGFKNRYSVLQEEEDFDRSSHKNKKKKDESRKGKKRPREYESDEYVEDRTKRGGGEKKKRHVWKRNK